MTIDFAKLAAGATIASDDAMPVPTSAIRRKPVDPALVALITEAAGDHKRRELATRFSLKPFEGRKGANECQSVVNELHRAAKAVGVKLAVRKFDITDKGARLTFKVITK